MLNTKPKSKLPSKPSLELYQGIGLGLELNSQPSRALSSPRPNHQIQDALVDSILLHVIT